MDVFYLIVGLALLVGAGDALVRGAVALSLRFGIPAFIVSATVVAFGTSAPELLIAIQAAIEGSPGIAFGNVVGSNTANVFLVLGVPALIAPLAACGRDAHRHLYMMLAATVLFTVLVLSGVIEWWGGLILLAAAGYMVWDSLREGLSVPHENGAEAEQLSELEDIDPHMPVWKLAMFLAVGLLGLPLGASLLIDGARGLAMDLGVSEAVIGVTLVAVGTSLPELATTVMAAVRRQADVAIGNVIGSNIFNITAILGAAAMFAPLHVPDEIAARDLWVMIAASGVLAVFVLACRRIGRIAGAVFLLSYAAYVSIAFL